MIDVHLVRKNSFSIVRLIILIAPYILAQPGFAQVSFEVSNQNGSSVVANFSDTGLMRILDNGEARADEILRVFVGEVGKVQIDKSIPVSGGYELTPGRITFEPLVRFSESLWYLAAFGDSVRYQFRFEKPPDRPGTVLTAVYPSSDTVPANLLKIYLEFSAPMREGEVYQRVTLLDQNNDLVKDPFVRLQPELWDSTGRRITLWLDPGRVKRALASSTFYGPVLEDGKSYCLQIDSLWKDIYGHRLGAGHKKKIVVTSADRKKPEIGFWTIKSPSPNTREPLMVKFNENMDLATTLKALSIWTADQYLIKGDIEIADNESSWMFVPISPWVPGEVQLKVESNLEDLAGNNLNRLFDRDLSNGEPLIESEVHHANILIGSTDQ